MKGLADDFRLSNIFNHFRVFNILTLGIKDVVPPVSNFATGIVHLLKGLAPEELIKHFTLEDLDDLELSSALELKSLNFSHLASVVEDSVAFLKHFVFFFRCRNHHAFVRAIDLKEDRHLKALLVGESGFVGQSLVLLVAVLLVDEQVTHSAREIHVHFLATFKLKFKFFREAFRQESPDTIGVQLKRHSQAIDHSPGVHDDLTSSVCDHSSHLHGVPSGTSAHDVPVERIKDNFMGQLKRLKERHALLTNLHLRRICCFPELCRPLFDQSLEFIASVAEVTHCVDVEGILSHADSVTLGDSLGFMYLLIGGAAVDLYSSLQFLVVLSRAYSNPLGHAGFFLVLNFTFNLGFD